MKHKYVSGLAIAGAALLFASGVSRLHAATERTPIQDAVSCSVTLGPTPAVAPAAGGTFTIDVLETRPAGCTSPLLSSAGFATMTRQAATVTVALTANVAAGSDPVGARAVTLQIADKTFRIVQDGVPAATPWRIGDVFVGAGSYADSPGLYRTLAPQGARLDSDSVAVTLTPVADLLDGAGFFSSGCVVDPTPAEGNGHLFTAAWTANTLSIFDGVTHQLRDVFRFSDPNTIDPYWGVGVNTPLAALPRSAGVLPLPPATIGVADDPLTPGNEFVAPEIQGFEQIVFANDGQFYVGTQTPPTDNALGLGRAYLLRFKYTPEATYRLTLTGWWELDAGAVADRQADRDAELNDAYADGTSRGASGVDQFDLSSDQKTIFYTSEDNYIRRFDVAAGTQLPSIQLTDAAGNTIAAKAYGIRILPGTPADGSAGFLVATTANLVFRVDANGKEVARYDVPAKPFALTLTPDAQYFWTALTQGHVEDPNPAWRIIYRFHIPTGTREGFEPGTSGVHGLCLKGEYAAATANGVCPVPNADGSYGPGTGVCTTPPVCAAVRNADSDPACFPRGVARPVYEAQANSEGDTVFLDLNRPGLVFNHVRGLTGIQGLTFAGGVISGTISPDTCTPGPGEDPDAEKVCEFPLHVQWLVQGDIQTAWNEAPFTWTIRHGNARPKVSLRAGAPTRLVVLEPATIALSITDADTADHVLVSMTGLPPGMSAGRRTSFGDGETIVITGAPAALSSYPRVFPVHVDIWDCEGGLEGFAVRIDGKLRALAQAGATASEIDGVLRADVAAALSATPPGCYHNATSLDFTITVVDQISNRAPVCSTAMVTPLLIWPANHKLVPFSITNATDPDGDPVTIVITSIFQDQPVNDAGDGSTGFDATGVGTSSAAVRAERTGLVRVNDDGRLYEVNFTASDGKAGGLCEGTVFIGVPQEQGQLNLPTDNRCRWDSVSGIQRGSCPR